MRPPDRPLSGMPILIDKDARINLLFPNSLFRFSPRRSELKALRLKQLLRAVSVGIVTFKRAHSESDRPAVQRRLPGTREAIAEVRDGACDVGLWHDSDVSRLRSMSVIEGKADKICSL